MQALLMRLRTNNRVRPNDHRGKFTQGSTRKARNGLDVASSQRTGMRQTGTNSGGQEGGGGGSQLAACVSGGSIVAPPHRRDRVLSRWHGGFPHALSLIGLLLLLMSEENAFWTLMAIIDDYFDGYYTEEMIESQVDQLVLEELVLNHLDYLGVEVAWIAGPWFLSIFVNMLPWESVLRVWDVLLFEGTRVMLFRTALALLELYGPALVTTKDAGDAVTLLQSLTGSTFDSSQLVLTAYSVDGLPLSLTADQEPDSGIDLKKQGGLDGYSEDFQKPKVRPWIGISPPDVSQISGQHWWMLELTFLAAGRGSLLLNDGQMEVTWLKAELCALLEEKKSAVLRPRSRLRPLPHLSPPASPPYIQTTSISPSPILTGSPVPLLKPSCPLAIPPLGPVVFPSPTPAPDHSTAGPFSFSPSLTTKSNHPYKPDLLSHPSCSSPLQYPIPNKSSQPNIPSHLPATQIPSQNLSRSIST
ncbi:hypothetical protein KSP40_PGU011837 [Platanthera guangdongensis]|uniref:Rab-GAP TBC domain-containing protein n=1 Tax=Platanthera guangdongensis TaxID=2320717 RepID=A0ABR2LU88_9ASPA